MMTTQEVANRLIELCRKNDTQQALKELYIENFVSLEPEGAPNRRSVGHAAQEEKGKRFRASIKVLNKVVWSEPIIAENFFSVGIYMNVDLANGTNNVDMNEIGVYQVREGKIVQEQFFHTVPPSSVE